MSEMNCPSGLGYECAKCGHIEDMPDLAEVLKALQSENQNLRAVVNEVYDKYKHLGKKLEDVSEDSFQGKIAADLWKAIESIAVKG